MKGALEAAQTSMIAALQSHAPLISAVSGMYDGPPPRAVFPYIAMATGASIDWSHKTGQGRELSLAVTVYTGPPDPVSGNATPLHSIMAMIETALSGEWPAPEHWQIVTTDFRRTRILRSADGPWSGLVEYRARLLQKTNLQRI